MASVEERLEALRARVDSVELRIEQVSGDVYGMRALIQSMASAASTERRALHGEAMRRFDEVFNAMVARLEALEASDSMSRAE